MKRALMAFALASCVVGCRAPQEKTPAPAPTDTTAPAPALGAAAHAESTAVVDVIRRYYAAIDARDYAAAYAEWGPVGGASGQTYAEFASGFAETAHTAVEITGPTPIEGGAGSLYATVPVRVHATTTAGAAQEFAGTYDLRRINDVPGATPAQQRWHLIGAKLAAVE